jgi:hypothetical protein
MGFDPDHQLKEFKPGFFHPFSKGKDHLVRIEDIQTVRCREVGFGQAQPLPGKPPVFFITLQVVIDDGGVLMLAGHKSLLALDHSDAVRRVGENKIGFFLFEQLIHYRRVGGTAANQAVRTEGEDVAFDKKFLQMPVARVI